MGEFREVGIIRDPQPNDVLVVAVPGATDADTCDHIGEMLRGRIGCRVVVVSDGIRVGDDGAAAELAALKARRCDGCEFIQSPPMGDWCAAYGHLVRPDHACNTWRPKPTGT